MSKDEGKTDLDNFSILLQLSPEFKLLLNEDGTARSKEKLYPLKKLKNIYTALIELMKTPADSIWCDIAWDIYSFNDQGHDAYVGRWRLRYFANLAFEGIVDDVSSLYKIFKDIDKNAPKCSWPKLRDMSGLICP